jgi:hypothetical protein
MSVEYENGRLLEKTRGPQLAAHWRSLLFIKVFKTVSVSLLILNFFHIRKREYTLMEFPPAYITILRHVL